MARSLVIWMIVAAVIMTVVLADDDGKRRSAPTPSSTLSGCQLCAKEGDCSHAYLGGPGQYCGPWLDRANQRQSCCCPRSAVCRNTNYECRCGPIRNNGGRHGGRHRNDGTSSAFWAWFGSILGFLALILLCGACCYCISRKRNDQMAANDVAAAIPVASAPRVYSTSGGGSGHPQYLSTNYQYGMPYTNSGGGGGSGVGGSGMGAGTGAALGGAAGLATGMLLGHHMGRHDVVGGGYDRGYSGDDGGDYGGGGGYDGGGDYGGGGDGGGDFAGDF